MSDSREYKHPVCRGSWALGTSCGKCERCLATRPSYTLNKEQQTKQSRITELEAATEQQQSVIDELVEALEDLANGRGLKQPIEQLKAKVKGVNRE